jgi:protein Tex
MNFTPMIAAALNIRAEQVTNTLALFDDGGTIPFIARYRKEATGGLDEVQIADIKNLLTKYQELEKRRESILKSIEEQGKLTDELRAKIVKTMDLTELEDLYLPYKRSRQTRASKAREKGLEPLALWIMEQKTGSVLAQAEDFVNDKVPNTAEAIVGAQDIIAELVNESQDARFMVRTQFERFATVTSRLARGKEDEAAKYKDYFDFSEPLNKCPSHRLLAVLRAEEEGFLRVSVQPNEEEVVQKLERQFVKNNSEAANYVREAVQDCYKRLLASSIETEYRNIAKEKADTEAIHVFSENLRQLLLAPPLGQKRVLALDPGFRTGCKTVVLDAQGELVLNTTIFLHQERDATAKIKELIEKFQIEAIAIGNGTASRETEALVRTITDKLPSFGEKPIEIFVVSEAGASIYSASDVAREEFPDHDVTVRGSISIGRRLMDPLAELVKIDPKSIGVGQYQHDVDQKRLKNNLDLVVESAVNSVGVDVNTASKHLLTYIAGLGEKLAANVVAYRAENGAFATKAQLKKVPRMGDKAFEQCAGFLRVKDGKNPLDNTAVHPERYALVETMAKDLNCKVADLIKNDDLRKQINIQKYVTAAVGAPTLNDIVAELAKPGLDPRGSAQSFSFDQSIRTLEDVKIGMILPGIITNIAKFGVFVDIGIKENGLVHVSQIANKYVSDPSTVVKLHQQVEVRVLEIDRERKRVQLSMKDM